MSAFNVLLEEIITVTMFLRSSGSAKSMVPGNEDILQNYAANVCALLQPLVFLQG